MSDVQCPARALVSMHCGVYSSNCSFSLLNCSKCDLVRSRTAPYKIQVPDRLSLCLNCPRLSRWGNPLACLRLCCSSLAALLASFLCTLSVSFRAEFRMIIRCVTTPLERLSTPRALNASGDPIRDISETTKKSNDKFWVLHFFTVPVPLHVRQMRVWLMYPVPRIIPMMIPALSC